MNIEKGKEKKKELGEIKYFDVHSHLHSDFFIKKEDPEKILKKMESEKIYSIIIGVDYDDSKKATEMSFKNKNLFCSVGIHPTTLEEFDDNKFNIFFEKENKVVCIGECGLDYYWPKNDLKKGKITEKEFNIEIKRQKKLFEKHIDFAVKKKLPLMLHIRSFENADAHMEAFNILDKKQKEHFGKTFEEVVCETGAEKNKIEADFHFFTESEKIVDEVIKRGFMISLPGVITFSDLDKSIKKIPLSRIMSETDSPFAAPKPFRGKTNTPLYVPEIVKKIAEVKNIKENEIEKIILENTFNFFNIK